MLGGCGAPALTQPVRVGLLFPDTRDAYRTQFARFERKLEQLGLLPGVVLDPRYAPAGSDLDAHAESLAASGAAAYIGVTLRPTVALLRATEKQASPVLFIAIGDPLALGLGPGLLGLMPDMRGPGRRITGSSDLVPDIARGRLDLLAQVVPGARDVAFISNAAITPREPLDAAAAANGLRLVHVDVREPADFAAAYARMAREPVHALVVTPNAVTFAERHRLAAWARERRLPTVFGWREFMDAGGLLTLGANTGRLFEVAAEQLAAVLRGTPPARIPVARATPELVVDLRTAAAIGVTVPQAVLDRADEVLR